MINKIVWSASLVSLVAVESYSFMPRKYMFAGLTTKELFGYTNTVTHRVRLFIKVPLVFSLCSVLFLLIYPTPRFTNWEKAALFATICGVRILLSANLNIPKYVNRRIISWSDDTPPVSPVGSHLNVAANQLPSSLLPVYDPQVHEEVDGKVSQVD